MASSLPTVVANVLLLNMDVTKERGKNCGKMGELQVQKVGMVGKIPGEALSITQES